MLSPLYHRVELVWKVYYGKLFLPGNEMKHELQMNPCIIIRENETGETRKVSSSWVKKEVAANK